MWIDKLALVLLIIGGLNWGLVGIFSFDLVAWIFGGQTAGFSRVIFTIVGLAGGQGAVLSRIVYIVVALSAAWCISLLFRGNSTSESAA